MTITDNYDAAADFSGPELYAGDPELPSRADLTGDPADDEPFGRFGEPEPAPEPEPERKKPGPRPNPNSARQRKLARKQAPRKRPAPNARASSAPAPTGNGVYVNGARTILGWVAQPLAMAGLASQIAAQTMPTKPDGGLTPRAVKTAQLGEALALDSLTISVHAEPLAHGMASLANNLPWMAAALEKAGKISPFAEAGQAAIALLLQVACNHGLLPATRALGTLSPAELRTAAGLDDVYADPE